MHYKNIVKRSPFFEWIYTIQINKNKQIKLYRGDKNLTV